MTDEHHDGRSFTFVRSDPTPCPGTFMMAMFVAVLGKRMTR
jgi:hypothetical protein